MQKYSQFYAEIIFCLSERMCLLQVVSQYSGILSPIAVDAVLRVSNPAVTNNVDLNDIKIVKKIG